MARARADRDRIGGLIHNLGIAYQYLGRYDDALRCLLSGSSRCAEPAYAASKGTAVLPVASACGDREQYGRAHDGLGRTCLAIGATEAARDHWTQALTVYEEIGVPE